MDIYAQNKKGENPIKYMLTKASNSNICDILLVAEYFLSIGVPVTDKAVWSVKKLATSFEFYRSTFNQEKLAETDEVLWCLRKIFDIPAPPSHICQHTYYSNMAKAGMNPKTLQYIMGNSDIGVTLNTYTHVQYEDAERDGADF